MTPKFTTPCFIHKNTSSLRETLLSIGYKTFDSCDKNEYLQCFSGYWVNDRPELKDCFGIDCGENESLFIAIASLRNDSDVFQWFTDGEDWRISTVEDWSGYDEVLWLFDPKRYHKATLEELIEHFKNKNSHAQHPQDQEKG